MTPEQINAAIAKAIGMEPWWKCPVHGEVSDDRVEISYEGNRKCPWCGELLWRMGEESFYFSLDAMVTAEKTLTHEEQILYSRALFRLTAQTECEVAGMIISLPRQYWFVATATAAQRTEAFLRVKGLWEDEKP